MPVDTIDENKDGQVDKQEFGSWFSKIFHPKGDNVPAVINQSFDLMDQNNDGVITPEEATPEEEQRWNDHFEAKDSPSTELAVQQERANSGIGTDNGLPPPGELDALPAPYTPETQTETQGQMQPIKPYPPTLIGTKQMDGGLGVDIEENSDWRLPFIKLGITHQPGLKLDTKGDDLGLDDPTGKGITWDDTKNALQKIGDTQDGIVGSTTLDGIQEDDFNPEVENPSYSTGHAIEPPPTDSAETSPALAKIGSASRIFNDIMSGKVIMGMPHTPNKVGASKGNTLAKMAKAKSGSAVQAKQTPLNLKNGKKLNISQGKENIYERIIDKVSKNYQHWPSDKDGVHYKEKGVVAVYVRGDWISVKYGSYRKTLLDTFAQEHPQFLPNILEVVSQ